MRNKARVSKLEEQTKTQKRRKVKTFFTHDGAVSEETLKEMEEWKHYNEKLDKEFGKTNQITMITIDYIQPKKE
ncbi:MAG: Unknown protein [uncultured Sulfurovum sp.]|uniref:Uncharacterized protein n=1 Tax=uncultured Sulfurovum sp. TaxID=269237 RepID=A0A6S6TPD4_9BACT|nr:MAG: Unknown protein [uncultured Sulfurovum sp.]